MVKPASLPHISGTPALWAFCMVSILSVISRSNSATKRGVSANLVAKVNHIGLEGQRRRNRDLPVGNNLQGSLIHGSRMEDEIKPRLRRAIGRVRTRGSVPSRVSPGRVRYHTGVFSSSSVQTQSSPRCA